MLLHDLISHASYAKEQTYILIYGGGVDDYGLGLKDSKGKKIDAYCVGKCGAWFEPATEHDGENLKKKYIGKKVSAELSFEENRGRVVGPSDDEQFYFIKKIKLLN